MAKSAKAGTATRASSKARTVAAADDATPPRVELAVVADDPAADDAAPAAKTDAAVKLKTFLERVVARSGAKKNEARPVVEAVLDVLGEALHAGEELNLPPLGKIKVSRQKDTGGGEVLVVRLKRGGAKPKVAATEALADDED
jgi:DNA-binding protein HU-alpha